MQLINADADMHMHTLNFSDGLNTVDEMVAYAMKLGIKRIAITDHSSAVTKDWGGCPWKFRLFSNRWQNTYGAIEVIIGVEADLLNAKGDVCMDIQGITPDFVILSAHIDHYEDDPSTITQGYLNALNRFKDKISCIGHLDSFYFENHVDVLKVINLANELKIPLEFNAGNLVNKKTNLKNAHIILKNAQTVMVNSDAHMCCELESRQAGFDFLKEHGYVKEIFK